MDSKQEEYDVERNEDYEFMLDYLDDWLYFYKIDNPRSYDTRLRQLKYFDVWCRENTNADSISDITYSTVKKYVYSIKEDFSDKTVEGRTNTIIKVIDEAVAEEDTDLDESPFPRDFDYVEQWNIDRTQTLREKYLKKNDLTEGVSKDEYELMRENVKPPQNRNQLLIDLLWTTGARASEIVSITDEDIDKDRRIIEIPDRKKDDENATRLVRYGKQCDLVLDAWQTDRNRYQCFKDSDEDWVFVSRKTAPMYSDLVSKIVRETAEEAGIQQVIGQDAAGRNIHYINAHSLRHGHGTWAADRVGIHRVQSQLGHSSVELSEEKYVHQENAILDDDIKDPYEDIY